MNFWGARLVGVFGWRVGVSLPAAEVGGVALPGSVMSAAEAMRLPVSRGLRCAVALVEGRCRAEGVETVYLARPEIFAAPGAGSAWLREKLGGATEHLCISDGSTVKPVDGCRTHIFMYRMSFTDSHDSFWRLCRRAPALMAQVASQVNTRFAWGGDKQCAPASVYMRAEAVPAGAAGAAYRFQFRPYLAEETAARILASGGVEAGGGDARYVPLTETGLADAGFARAVALMIRGAFIDRGRLLLRLPEARPGGSVAGRMAAVLAALAKTGVVLPRHVAETIFFLTADFCGDDGSGLDIFVHESFDFWRHSRAFYEGARSVTVGAGKARAEGRDFLPADVSEIFGGRASRVWLEAPARVTMEG